MNSPKENTKQKDEKDTGYSKSAAPSISMPKGGGAMKGIDEKFSVNAVNGTSGMTIPVPSLKTRSDFAPGLTLSYNSGGGNSEFGLGWGLSLPSIQRKTDKQLPKYNDAEERDVFLFAGAEDLVPVNGGITVDGDYTIKLYQPRIEGLFARIEKIRKTGDAFFYWKVTTKDNLTTFFGLTAGARLCDPDETSSTRIYKWLPDFSFDDKGNYHVFEYLPENLNNVPRHLHEQQRHNGLQHYANVYLKKIKYGNHVPFYLTETDAYAPVIPTDPHYYTTVFDYGDHDEDLPTVNDYLSSEWTCRKDPFSDYHAGFEIRTYRLCRRVLCFSHFDELFLDDIVPFSGERLITSLNLTYKFDDTVFDLLETDYIIKATQWMYRWHEGDSEYKLKALPPMRFTYQEPEWDTSIHNISRENLVNAPTGLSSGYQWMDFYGEGISGILTEQAEGWYYKTNWGDGTFSPAQKIAPKPNFTGLQLQDLDADGKKYAVSTIPGVQGYFELDDDDNWQNFRAFKNVTNIDVNDPNTRMLDLNGDGLPDILISQERVFTYYESKGTDGYEGPKTAPRPLDENKGAAIVFADSTQSIYLADMSGDGMTDIVRIRNKDICYWPNLGYGRFGAKVIMSNAPLMDKADQFNPAYIHLSDITGTGASDLIYLGKHQFKAWLNLSGNGWSEVQEISPFPHTESPNTLSVIDLLGNGTSCLVWSSPLPQYATAPMRYIDLMGGKKPYLMKQYNNSAGKEVTLTYKSSTHYYLEDKKAGKPWITKLPFPVHCVEKTETKDLVSDTVYSNLYTYHHGYYDHAEREFRGFGRVETLDTETFVNPNPADDPEDVILDEPPILTKTWYHTGAWIRQDKILNHYKKEYYVPDGAFAEHDLVQPSLPAGWTAIECREALRALKGVPLRQEVYAQDGTEQQSLPYTAIEYNYDIRQIQAKDENRFAVYLVHEKENIAYNYERNPDDPRVAHSLNIEIDEYANIKQAATVVYGRKDPPLTPTVVHDEQIKIHVIYTLNEYTNDINVAEAYRLRLPYYVRQFELTGSFPEPDPDADYFTTEKLLADFIAATEIDYSVIANNTDLEKRLVEAQKIIFLADDAVTPLSETDIESKAIPYQTYRLAFTEDLIADVYDTKVDVSDMVIDEGKYIEEVYILDGASKNYYWIPSGTVTYDEYSYDTPGTPAPITPADHFFLPYRYTDPFWGTGGYTGNKTHLKYYGDYHLLLEGTKDELGDVTLVKEWEWRILQPSLMMDINDNHTNMVYDILGMPVGMALMGKGSPGGLPTEADSLDGFEADLSNTVRDDFFEDPIDDASGLLLEATARFIYDYDHVPLKVATIIREVHNASDPDSPLQLAFEYSDGLGRLLMKKVQAEPGGFFYIEDDVLHEYRPDDAITYPPPTGWDGHRWVGTGRTILNNKGKPIKQYEPYFSSTHLYEYDSQLVQVGFSPVIRYDAVGRAIRTDMPDGTYNKVEFDAWMQRTYDANDNVNDSLWKADRETGGIYYGIAEEMDALAKTVIHANTPLTVHTDSLARSIYTIQHNKVWTGLIWDDEFIESFVVLDIESNTKQVIDGRVNTQFIYAHDMLGNIIYQKSIDSGERWMLNDLFGKPIYGWDSMGQKAHNVFDKLHRPTEGYIDDGVTDRKISEIIYGTASADNNIGQIYQSYDGSGKTEVVKYDFKGNLLQSILQLLSLETIIDVDWGTSPTLATETFTTTMKYDALNRPYYMKDAGNNVTVNEYNEAGLLTKVSMKPDGASLYTDYVADIDYNAKGQREAIWYGNGTKTKYTYHLKSFRLTRLLTTKSSSIFQDLNYYYDPVGNITTLRDDNYDTINNEQLMFFNNDVVSPTQAFTYDALYRLTEASGRELKGENSFGTNDNYNDSYWLTSHKGNGNNVQNYTQKYKYDKVGNIMQLKHIASAKSYTRDYTYYSDSNKLKMTEIGTASYRIYNSTTGDPYYDAHGNITKMPHLVSMVWNALDQLSYVSVGTSTTNYYQYGGGQRVRKTTNKSGGIKEQRIYLGSYEIYRKFTSGSLTVERKTVHIADDTGRIALYEKRTVGTGTSDGGTTAELIRYIYSNHLQSSSLELDNTAAIISYEEYHPFGTTSYQAMNASIKAVAKRYRYTGKERDEESGFYFHGARYYIPWLCRWSAVDPLESKFAGMSSYNYSFNNPVMWNDPDGKDPNDDKKKQSKSVKGKGSGSVGLKSTSAKPTTPKKDLATHPDAPKFKNAGDKEKKYDVRKADPETPYQKNLRDRKRIEENMQIIAANRAKAAALDPYAYNLGNSPGVQAGLTVVLPGVAIVQGATQAYEGFQTNNNVQFGLGVATVALGTYSAAKSMNGNFNAAPEQKFIPKIENTNGPGVGTKFTLSMEEAAKMNPEYSTRTTGNAYRYMVEGELIATRETGLLRGGRPGESYFTLDLYKSAIKVQQRLALPTAPTLRVEFEILSNPVMLRNGLKVYPAYGMPGKGAEFMTTDPVKINVINWQKLGH